MENAELPEILVLRRGLMLKTRTMDDPKTNNYASAVDLLVLINAPNYFPISSVGRHSQQR